MSDRFGIAILHGDGPNGEMFTDCFYPFEGQQCSARLRGHLQPHHAVQRIKGFRLNDAQRRPPSPGAA